MLACTPGDVYRKNKVVACTHDGVFHADDVFAVATLSIIHGDDLLIVRSRNEEVMEHADFVIDVGGRYDGKRWFDHHQSPPSRGSRKVPCASFGLVWRKFGAKAIRKSLRPLFLPEGCTEVIWRRVDNDLVLTVDAVDTQPTRNVNNWCTISNVIGTFNPTWLEELDFDARFMEAVKLAESLLRRMISLSWANYAAGMDVLEQIERCDKTYLVQDVAVPWKSHLGRSTSPNTKNILHVIYPAPGKEDTWNVQCTPGEGTEGRTQKLFPKAWRGKKNSALVKETGIRSALFCHQEGFLFVTGTKEDAVLAAETAAEAQ